MPSGFRTWADLLIAKGLGGVLGVLGESLTGFSSLKINGLHWLYAGGGQDHHAGATGGAQSQEGCLVPQGLIEVHLATPDRTRRYQWQKLLIDPLALVDS